MITDYPEVKPGHCPKCEQLQRELDEVTQQLEKKIWKDATDCEIIWYRLIQEARSCQRNWGMGFPVISTELLRKYWHESTGFMPPERTKEFPKR